MYQEKILRYIRLKNGISTLEMSKALGISQPRYTHIELSDKSSSEHSQKLLESGFENLIAQRKKSVLELEADYQKYKDKLLDWEDFS